MVFQTDYGGFQVYHNNFYNLGRNTMFLMTNMNATDADFPPWDNGYPSGGNYWSDYTTRYPNATEIDDSGIGDIPYNVTIGPFTPNLTVLDRYPLLSPFNIPSAGSETPQLSQTPTPGSSPTQTAAISSSPQKSPQQNEAITTVAAVLAAVAAITIVVFVTLRRNRARPKSTDPTSS
jgi:nitrous oxidase accessory protein NosD